MSVLEEIEKRALALPLDQRVFLAESLLGSLPPIGEEISEDGELAEAERRQSEIERGMAKPLSDSEFWLGIEAGKKK
jgi:hypothetical protein